MKKFFTFLIFLGILIVAEYYFFTELFSQKRITVILPGLAVMAVAIFSILRFAKKTLTGSKTTSTHN